LGVAGGEPLIPTIVLLYGIDIKTAGSLSLLVSLPTMLVALARYSSFGVLRNNIARRSPLSGSTPGTTTWAGSQRLASDDGVTGLHTPT
jgi:uncharacterized membrane protein YfcA